MAKIRSFGAKLYLNGVAVGGITDIQASGVDVSFIDNTTHDSAGGFRTFVSGLKDGGTLEITGKYNYADAGQDEWKAEEGMRHAVYIILSDNSGLAFEAIVGGFTTSNPLDDAVEFTATAKITGEVFPVFPTMTVTGTLNDGTNDVSTPIVLTENGTEEGRPRYDSDGGTYVIVWEGSRWLFAEATGLFNYTSASNTLTPDEATGWTAVSPATGTPIITGS